MLFTDGFYEVESPDNIRRKHIEEGISRFENCVECHRSANEHGGEGGREGSREGRGGGEHGGRGDDD